MMNNNILIDRFLRLQASAVFMWAILAACAASAQRAGNVYLYKAPLPKVEQNGFYNIRLSPTLLGLCQTDGADIRLLDENGYEVPFVWNGKPRTVNSPASFVPYSIHKLETAPNRFTELVIENRQKLSVNEISLLMANTDVAKKASLSAGNDGKQWFIIKENIDLGLRNEKFNDTLQCSTVYFPQGKYLYYRLVIDDSLSLPIDIKAAGYFKHAPTATQTPVYERLAAPNVERTEYKDAQCTVFKVTLGERSVIDALQWPVTYPSLYKRWVSVGDTLVLLKEKPFFRTRNVAGFEMQSGSDTLVTLPAFRAKEFYLVVYNENNLPLETGALSLYAQPQHLTAELKKGAAYALVLGNSKAAYPQYELGYFTEKIPEVVANISPLPVEQNKAAANEEKSSDGATQQGQFLIWGALLIGIVVLGFLSFNMLKSMKNGK